MAKSFDEQFNNFLKVRGGEITGTIYILNGMSDEQLTEDDLLQFIMECLTEGLEVLKARAEQMLEQKIMMELLDFDKRNGNDETKVA